MILISKVPALDLTEIMVKRDYDLNVYIHQPGDEFWIGATGVPYQVK